jgi:hypothetical protein
MFSPYFSAITNQHSPLVNNLGPERACVGLVFGLSPQARPQARPPGQACKSPSPQCKARARPEPALFRPTPALEQFTTYLDVREHILCAGKWGFTVPVHAPNFSFQYFMSLDNDL